MFMKPLSHHWRTSRERLLWVLIFGCVGLCAFAVDLDPVLRGRWPGFVRGPAQSVAIQNGYSFVAAGGGGLFIIDVSNPANPQRVGGYATSGNALGVAVSGNYASVTDGY